MELSDEARTFLNEMRFATLATINADGTIQQTVMWYLLRDDTIVMNTAKGRQKERNLGREPRLSICVEDGYRYVTMTGTVTMIDDPNTAQADVAELAVRYHGAEGAAPIIENQFRQQERISLVMPIERSDERGFDGTI